MHRTQTHQPFRAALAARIPATELPDPPTAYCPRSQVSVIGGVATVRSPRAAYLLGKKTNTAEGGQTISDEVAK